MAPACAGGFGPAAPVGEVARQDALGHQLAEIGGRVDFAEPVLWRRLFVAQQGLDVGWVARREDVAGLVVVVLEQRVSQPGLGGVGADLVVRPQPLCFGAGEFFKGLARAASCLFVSFVLVGRGLFALGGEPSTILVGEGC